MEQKRNKSNLTQKSCRIGNKNIGIVEQNMTAKRNCLPPAAYFVRVGTCMFLATFGIHSLLAFVLSLGPHQAVDITSHEAHILLYAPAPSSMAQN
jgi:hypothetical protein